MDTNMFLDLLESNVKVKQENKTLANLASKSLTIASTLAQNNSILKGLMKELLEVPNVPDDLRTRCESILNK